MSHIYSLCYTFIFLLITSAPINLDNLESNLWLNCRHVIFLFLHYFLLERLLNNKYIYQIKKKQLEYKAIV